MSGLLGYGLPSAGTDPDFTGPGLFSFLVPAYAERYGIDEELVKDAMTHIAWKNHSNGAKNPRAHFRKEVSRETIRPPLRSPAVWDLRLFRVSDGSAAAVVVPPSRPPLHGQADLRKGVRAGGRAPRRPEAHRLRLRDLP